ncbi:MAG: multiheme c-type cytochrome [Bryobacteraceae bacterium]
MARTSGVVQAASEHAGTSARGGYRITPEMRLEWRGGAVDLTFFIGSRRMGRSYAYSHDGHLFQAPVGFYANRNLWDLAPGYERDPKPDFGRPITAECLFCHATGARLEPGTVNRYREMVHGIQCARCHGNATEHEQLVNPAKLAPRLRDSVCEQCHLSGAARIVRAGKRMDDFRAGEDIAEYIEVLNREDARGGVRVNGHSDALAMSRCKESGGKLWCGTCHSPHGAAAPDYAAVCRSCHAQAHAAASARQGDCTSCHMPKSKARDGGHTVFTDHSLRVKAVAPRPGSYFGRAAGARDLGLAYVEMGRTRRDTEYFEKAWPLLRKAAEANPRDPALYAAIGRMLEADGRREQAVRYYRVSLDQDPLQPDLLNRLAEALGGSSAEAKRLRERSAEMLPRPF